MLSGLFMLAAIVSVNFNKEIGTIRPELHSSGFGPQICSCPKESMDAIRSMGSRPRVRTIGRSSTPTSVSATIFTFFR